jgi:hypothetical protein
MHKLDMSAVLLHIHLLSTKLTCFHVLPLFNNLRRLYNVTIEFEPLGSWCGALAQGAPRSRKPSTGYSFLDQLLGMPGSPGAAAGVDFNLDLQDGLRASLNIGDLFDFNLQVGE